MAALTLKALLGRRSPAYPVVASLVESLGNGIRIVDASGAMLLGPATAEADPGASCYPVEHDDIVAGHVIGPACHAAPLASLLNHLWSKEVESRSLGAEVLHLYREVHLIEQLCEQLAQVLDLPAIARCALDQAQRLIKTTYGCIFLQKPEGELDPIAAFGASDSASNPNLLPLVASILQKGLAEIVNDCATDARIQNQHCGQLCGWKAILCAPLRSGERIRGAIVLATDDAGASYSSPDLKLLNTIALQTAAAVENALLCAEMVEAARHRAAYAAELQAASSVQQLLLQGGSRSIPGFDVRSVYLPASEVGGDFYLIYPGPDGALIAIIGDVSGKGLTAAMRVALILGALRRESSFEPAEILASLNNALVAQGQLGFTTALCIRVAHSGEFALANAGHIPPYLGGNEFETPPALPLGLIDDQVYATRRGRLAIGEQLMLLSDGVPEARSADGELYGFSRLPALTRGTAEQVAEAARAFGQEDDITVVSIILS